MDGVPGSRLENADPGNTLLVKGWEQSVLKELLSGGSTLRVGEVVNTEFKEFGLGAGDK